MKINKIAINIMLLFSISVSSEALDCRPLTIKGTCSGECGTYEGCYDRCISDYVYKCEEQTSENLKNEAIIKKQQAKEWADANVIKKSSEYSDMQAKLLKERSMSDPKTLACAYKSPYDSTSYGTDFMKNNKSYSVKGLVRMTNIRIYDVNSIPYVFVIRYYTSIIFSNEINIDYYYPLTTCVNESELVNTTWSAYSKAYVWGKLAEGRFLSPHGFSSGLTEADLEGVKKQFLADPKEKIEE